MPSFDARELADRLAREAEDVCRRYLGAGRRRGRYWQVGDVRNAPGRSMFVRLVDDGPRRAGKWRDAATGERGDLLDVIRESESFHAFADVAEEARRFLALPRPPRRTLLATPRSSPEAARRLFAMSRPVHDTLAETYLRKRGVATGAGLEALRFHAACFHQPDDGGPLERRPAMIAAVTDLSERVVGAQRTWLAPDGSAKASIATPRKAMGDLLGHAVRFGPMSDVLAAGEGIETVLSVKTIATRLACAAALSAGHLTAIAFPSDLRRLYVILDRDAAGLRATEQLAERAQVAGIEAITLAPRQGDFNDDLRIDGEDALFEILRAQLAPEDVARFMTPRS